jgi:2-succinyl-6-hydroxy-2,4-cyclohexadiene-1-carboxylate synthase
MIWKLHGALGSSADFEEGMAVDLYDQVAPYAEWAAKFCQHVRERDEAPLLLGYSMGGRLALHALLEEPGMWRGAVIISADYGHGRDEGRIQRDAEWARLARELPWEEFMERWNAQPVFAGTSGTAARAWRDSIPAAFEYWSVGRQENLLPRLAELELPVLWIVGERDAKFVRLGEEAVAALPLGRLEIVKDAGHRVLWDQSQRIAELVSGFKVSL